MAQRVNLRPATRADIQSLVRFSAALAKETEARVLEPRRLRCGVASILGTPARGFFRVAEIMDGGSRRIVGQLMVTYEWSEWRNSTFWWIQSVYVDPSWRRQGVYRAMHEAIREEARTTVGVCGLRLYVEQANRIAQQSYRQMGMKPVHYLVFEDDFVLGQPTRKRASRSTPVVRRTERREP